MKVMKRARFRFRKMWEAGRFKRAIRHALKLFPVTQGFEELLSVIAERNLRRGMVIAYDDLKGATC